MKHSLLLLFALFMAVQFSSVLSRDCIPGGACVSYYSGPDCRSSQLLGSYEPTCAGNCFQYDSFVSLAVTGDGRFGTNCELFVDANCLGKIGETGNRVRAFCLNANGGDARSMRCYYKC